MVIAYSPTSLPHADRFFLARLLNVLRSARTWTWL